MIGQHTGHSPIRANRELQPEGQMPLPAGTLLPAEAAAGAEIAMHTQKAGYEQHLAVVESSGTATYSFPKVTTSGLSLPLDANVTDGVTAAELTTGITSRSPGACTVGAGVSMFVECELSIADISDLEQLIVGFRKAEAYQADPDNYDELAAIHIGETGATVADGQINILTILNNGATVYTDTTLADWADGGQHTLRVTVSGSGKVTFLVDGAVPTVTKVFSFDDGEVVVPFIYYQNTSGSTTGDPGIVLLSYKAGKL